MSAGAARERSGGARAGRRIRSWWPARWRAEPGTPRARGGVIAPRVALEVGPAVPAWLLWGATTVAGALVLVCAPTGILGRVVLGAALVALLVRPRGVAAGFWVGVVGLITLAGVPLSGVTEATNGSSGTAVLTSSTGTGDALALAGLVLGVHLSVVAARLVELLRPRSPIALGVLRGRLAAFWPPQLLGQLLALVVWRPWGGSAPWVTVAALVGAAVLVWLVLRPRPGAVRPEA